MLHTPQARRLDTTSAVGNLPWPQSGLYRAGYIPSRLMQSNSTGGVRCVYVGTCTCVHDTDENRCQTRYLPYLVTYLLANLFADLFLEPVWQHPNVHLNLEPPRWARRRAQPLSE
jgi:hypothetical protein